MLGGIGPMEIVLVLAIALIVLGPKKLPEASRAVGKGLREFKDSMAGVVGDDDDDDPRLDSEPEPTKSPR